MFGINDKHVQNDMKRASEVERRRKFLDIAETLKKSDSLRKGGDGFYFTKTGRDDSITLSRNFNTWLLLDWPAAIFSRREAFIQRISLFFLFAETFHRFE